MATKWRNQAIGWGALMLFSNLCSSCGFGTAGVVAGSRSSSSGGQVNDPPSVGAVTFENVQLAPVINFVLIDPERDKVDVSLEFESPTGLSGPMTLMGDTNLSGLKAAPAGEPHSREWDFVKDLGTASLTENVVVRVTIVGGTGSVTPRATVSEKPGNFGNDAPIIVEAGLPAKDEFEGSVDLKIVVSDSSMDPVDVVVEYKIVGEDRFRVARSAGTPSRLPARSLAFDDVATSRVGTEYNFLWESDFSAEPPLDPSESQLPGVETDVEFRVTVTDNFAPPTWVATAPFHVDNNRQPIVQIGGGFFVNPDEQRGIPLPYTVIDEEGDRVRVLFQWRYESELDFRPLGTTDPRDLATMIEDPGFVEDKRICTPFPTYARGYTFPVDATHVRLPELVQDESRILANGAEVRDLQLLRPFSEPERLASTWKDNPLVAPVAALPLGSGLTALVLDADGTDASRLIEVNLATGEPVPKTAVVASGISGRPSSMAFEAAGTSVLVATDLGGTWQLFRVDLRSGLTTALVSASAEHPLGPLRAVFSLGSTAALATAEDGLWRLEWSEPTSPRTTLLVGGLAMPWGLAQDPSRPGRVFVAERDAPVQGGMGRVVSIDPHTLAIEPVVASPITSGEPAFPSPTAIAFDRPGNRLIALCQLTGSSGRELRGLNLGRSENEVFSLGVLDGDAATVATGQDNLLLVALPMSVDLAAGGGVEQIRSLESFDPSTATATVATEFDPEVRNLQPWRIQSRDSFRSPIRGSRAGTQGVFVWDSRDVGAGRRVFLQAICMDADLGTPARITVARGISRFADPSRLSAGELPRSVVAADLDGDGDRDLVSANFGSSDLTVFYQDTPGTFTAQPPLATDVFPQSGHGPFSVVAEDLDGDGDLDLVTANGRSSDLTVFYQDASRTFIAQPPLATGTFPVSVAASDLDGDGDLDLVSANLFSNNLTVFYQGASGTFTAQPPLITGNGPHSVVAADLDGDSDLDLVSANFLSSNLTVFFQDGGTFSAQPPLATGNGPRSVAAADLDRDGDLDLVSANESSSDLTVFYQDAPRTFTAQPPLATGDGPFSVVVADLDGDGDLDLVSANELSHNLTVFYQEKSRTFTNRLPLPTRNPGDMGDTAPNSVAVADLDGDGDLDLVSANRDSNDLTVLYQGVPRDFSAQPSLATGDFPRSVAAADLDGDGDLELVSGNESSFDLTVFYQDEPRAFTAQLTLPTGDRPDSIAAADLDGDGAVDLVSANRDSDDLTLFYQDGPRIFTAQPPLATGDFPRSVAAADLDGDGDLDLVTANRSSDDLSVFYQGAPRTFTAGPPLATGNGPRSVAAADLDGDGDLDLVSANELGHNLTVLYQDAPRTFTAQTPIATGRGPLSVVAADLDGDGDLDLVTANGNSDDLTVFYQDAPRTFTARPPLATGRSPSKVVAADLDGDGDLDLVSSNELSEDLTLLYQDAPRTFTARPPLATASFPRSVVVGDVDGDGDPDLVSTGTFEGGGSLTVFFGGR